MKPCLILGNGPSLNDLPTHDLQFMPSYGSNFIHVQPTYYICIDQKLLTERPMEILARAQGAEIAYLLAEHKDIPAAAPLYALPNVQLVERDRGSFKAERYITGRNCTYVALKLAYYAGFDLIHLWGVDHDEAWTHFTPNYPPDPIPQGAPRRQVMRSMEDHYQLAANVYARAGRTILNHSHPSALDKIFRRA
jgi:hypothetical protein